MPCIPDLTEITEVVKVFGFQVVDVELTSVDAVIGSVQSR